MIQAQELRIGNYVNDEVLGNVKISEIRTKPQIIKVDTKCYINKDVTEDRTYTLSNWNPIPITEEILLKNKFKKFPLVIDEDMTMFHFFFGIFFIKVVFLNSKFIVSIDGKIIDIKYLHQLQNIYFALTNKELPITL